MGRKRRRGKKINVNAVSLSLYFVGGLEIEEKVTRFMVGRSSVGKDGEGREG